MTDEYDHLDHQILGHFKLRLDAQGRNVNPSPLDGLSYCQADLNEIGKDTQGFPNRVVVAAFTGDISFLALHGNADPSFHAKQLLNSRWKP